jgi:flagellar hook-length control protein FliK
MDVKTSGPPPDRPVRSEAEPAKPKESSGKSGSEFQSLMQHAGKQPPAGHAKGKPFAPMSEKKLGSHGGKHGEAAGSGKAAGQGAGFSVRSRKPTDQGLEGLDPQKKLKREAGEQPELTPEELAAKSAQQAQLHQGNLQATSVDKTQHGGLNIKEIESIVDRVSVGVNDKGHPEFKFELKTEKMGSLELKISAEQDQIRIDFAVHDAATQDLLEKNLGELSNRLRDRGLNLVQTNFTRQDQSEQQEQRQQQQERSENYPSSTAGPRKVFRL